MSSLTIASSADRRFLISLRRLALVLSTLAILSACATSSALRAGLTAEQQQDYDGAVLEYTKAVQSNPSDRTAREALTRAKLRAAQVHYAEGRRLANLGRYEDALAAYQLGV